MNRLKVVFCEHVSRTHWTGPSSAASWCRPAGSGAASSLCASAPEKTSSLFVSVHPGSEEWAGLLEKDLVKN